MIGQDVIARHATSTEYNSNWINEGDCFAEDGKVNEFQFWVTQSEKPIAFQIWRFVSKDSNPTYTLVAQSNFTTPNETGYHVFTDEFALPVIAGDCLGYFHPQENPLPYDSADNSLWRQAHAVGTLTSFFDNHNFSSFISLYTTVDI